MALPASGKLAADLGPAGERKKLAVAICRVIAEAVAAVEIGNERLGKAGAVEILARSERILGEEARARPHRS